MKKVILNGILFAFISGGSVSVLVINSAQAATPGLSSGVTTDSPCAAPRDNVQVQVNSIYYHDTDMPFCYVTELGTTQQYPAPGCEYPEVGDVLTGRITTYWTHKDANGVPVCDYQMFSQN